MICDASLLQTLIYLRIRNNFAFTDGYSVSDLELSPPQMTAGFFGKSGNSALSPVSANAATSAGFKQSSLFAENH